MTILFSLLLAGGLLVSPAGADPAPPVDSTVYQFDNDGSTMTVFGTSNVRDWTMDVTQITGRALVGEGDGDVPALQSVDLEVPVEQMTSDKDRLQRHAHEALKKEDYPTITFSSNDVTVSSADADSFAVFATGDLTIAGETRTVEVKAKGAQQADGTLHVVGEHELTLSEFNVERPSLMFGAIKVSDPIRLGFDVRLAPQQQTADTN